MTAATKPKTPSMTMVVNDGTSAADIDKFCKKASRLTLSQVIETVTVKERLAVKGSNRAKEFTIEISFFPREEYLAEYDVDAPEILSSFGIRFPMILKKEIQLELKKLDADLKSQITALGKGKVVRDTGAGADEADDEDGDAGPSRGGGDDASEIGDGDADEVKQAKKKEEMATYESDDDEDLDDEAIEAKFASDAMEDADDEPKELKKNSAAEVQSLFMDNCSFARSFKFDAQGCKIKLSVSFSNHASPSSGT